MPTLPPNKKLPYQIIFTVIRTKLPLAFTGLIFFSLLNWHCTKIDTTNLGSGLIPAVDNVNTFDTIISVVANNFDSIPLGNVCTIIYPAEDHALGSITNDPLFGTTKATIYTELKPSFFPFYWPATAPNMTLDSIVLVLSYKGTYGDSTMPQKVDVHEISNTFTSDSSSCSTYSFNFTILGSAIYTPERLKDSVKVVGDTSSNQLRIKLSNSFGQRLLSQDSTVGSALNSDSAFKVFLKGFAIVPDFTFGGNALTYYSLTDANTKLAIYFKFKRTGLADSAVVYNFQLNGLSASANNIVRNHTGAEISKYVSAVPRAAGDTVIYIQTTPGTYAEIKIPGLNGLSNRIINRAELTMDQVYSNSTLDNYFTAPSFLFLDMKDSANGFYHTVPCDLVASTGIPGIATFGGAKTSAKDPFGNDIARYTFNISRYVQKIVTNHRANTTLRLRAPDYIVTSLGYTDDCGLFVPALNYPINDPAFGRVKLGGGNNTNYKMKLRIIYSKL